MTEAAIRSAGDPLETLAVARQVIETEARALVQLASHLDESLSRAAGMIEACSGSLIVTGIGKAGLIGQKIAATFASTGTPSHFVHPVEAVHGDLGRVRSADVLLALSMSGRTVEVLEVVAAVGKRGVPAIAMTGRSTSPLGRSARLCLELGEMDEACPLGLAPSSSSTAMLALGDALAFVVSRRRGFTPEDFARFHPGGSLGRELARVKQVMRPASQCRIARQDETVRQLLVRLGRPGRRTGAVMIVDDQGRLVGIFTDSDLARLLECRADRRLDGPVAEVMTHRPVTVDVDSRVAVAVERLRRRKISELPVVDGDFRPVGLIDITDLLDEVPPERPGGAEMDSGALPGGAEPKILPFPPCRDDP